MRLPNREEATPFRAYPKSLRHYGSGLVPPALFYESPADFEEDRIEEARVA